MAAETMIKPFKFRKRKSVPGIARELLRCFEDPRRHSIGAIARAADGRALDTVEDAEAVAWCVMGASARADADGYGWTFDVAFERAAGDLVSAVSDSGLPAVRRVLRKLARGGRR